MLNENKESIASKIDSIFGDFGKSLDNREVTPFSAVVSAFESKTNQLVNIEQTEIKTIEDEEYLRFVFKHMIMIGMAAIETLATSMKAGPSRSDGENFGSAFKSVTECVTKLAEYNFKRFDLKNMMNPPVPAVTQNVQINNFEGTSSEIMDKLDALVDNARKNSQLNNVEAKFDLGIEKPL